MRTAALAPQPTPQADVVMVGAGPVGLWTAIQTKIINPELNIVLLDKYRDYRRIQPLRLDSKSWKGHVKHPELDHICQDFSKKKFVMTKEIEERFKGLAERLGIQFKVQTVQDPASLRQQFPNAKVIVGSDGYHSIIRKNIFGDQFRSQGKLQYIVQATYKIADTAGRVDKLRGSKMMSMVGGVVNEHVGRRQEDGTSRVSLRFFVSEDTYKQVQDARAKEPWKIDDPRVPKELRENIELWMLARRGVTAEQLVQEKGKVELTSIQLNSYASQKAVKADPTKPDLTWVLVGDSFSGVPFFRSLNKGLIEGTNCAKAIAHACGTESAPRINKLWRLKSRLDSDAYEGDVHPEMRAYASLAKSSFSKEDTLAKVKSFAIGFFGGFLRMVHNITPKFLMRLTARLWYRLQV